MPTPTLWRRVAVWLALGWQAIALGWQPMPPYKTAKKAKRNGLFFGYKARCGSDARTTQPRAS